MAEFPASPIPPKEYLEQWLPRAFAEAELPEDRRSVDFQIGLQLEGDGGGEWVFEVKDGALEVRAGSREETAFSYVQSVADWSDALWQGGGGAIGQGAAALFKPGSEPPAAGAGGPAVTPSPAALEEMRKLDGVIRMVVVGGEGGEWAVAFKLGPGPVPEEPTTNIAITAEDATAMGTGELDPMQAFMSGRMQVTGDMTLMMQMQAIQMQAAANAAAAAEKG